MKYFLRCLAPKFVRLGFLLRFSFHTFRHSFFKLAASVLSAWSPRSRKSSRCWTRRRCCCPRYTRPPPGPAPWPASPPLTTRAPAAPGRGTPSLCPDPGPNQSGWGIRWESRDWGDQGLTEDLRETSFQAGIVRHGRSNSIVSKSGRRIYKNLGRMHSVDHDVSVLFILF